MNELTYRALVWLPYRLAATFAVGVPLVLLIWSSWRREPLVLRLLGIYWKVASLMAISLLLLTDQRPLGYAMAVVAPGLGGVSLWGWGDITAEGADHAPRAGRSPSSSLMAPQTPGLFPITTGATTAMA